jgi:hypothetical protein
LPGEDCVVLVCSGRAAVDAGCWADLPGEDALSDARVAGRALREVFRQLAITEGGEANIAWVVSGLGYAQQSAAVSLQEAGFDHRRLAVEPECRLNMRADSENLAEQAYVAVMRHHRRARPQATDAGGTIRLLVAFGHQQVWKAVVSMTRADMGSANLARSLGRGSVVVMRRPAGSRQFSAVLVSAPQ